MKFTLVFGTHEKIDLSYGLLFVPVPAWYRGNQELVRLSEDKVEYQGGSVGRLLAQEQVLRALQESQRSCTIVVHPTGKGTLRDMRTLVTDLRQEGFTVTVVVYNGFEPFDLTVSF